ncbi:non-ribosomal peptide synthetase [Streptomyces sp. NBC_01590]|uniref:non-ribosomal peptide synthetase n=1 Tax=Streptomyces sp. NBC_01590 TaxID=2975887 RepID=UPI00386ACEA2
MSGSVLDLIRRTIAESPGDTAIEGPAGTLDYGEFGRRAEALAARLRARGVVTGAPVGVLASPSQEGVIALVAVAMAGAAYVPLCPSLPGDRLRAMVEDSGARLVVHTGAAAPLATLGVPAMPVLDASAHDTPHPPVPVPAESPVSVIYTSGSTGRPKGVLIPHRALANRIAWGRRVYPLGAGDRVLHHTRYIYDFSAWEVFATLAQGATLVAPEPANYPDFHELAESIKRLRITHAHFVPSVLAGVVGREAFAGCDTLRVLFSGGETLTNDLARRFRSLSDATLYNQYGPTETCVDSTFHRYEADDAAGPVPIGTAIDDTRLYVLDEELAVVPDGTEGELFISGPGVATGYLGRPGLTAERFLPDPYRGVPGARMYRTGDLVVRRGDGALEFRGRADLQVNLRGIRVELEEVESVLALDDDVVAAVAAVVGDDSPALVAMVFPAQGAVVDPAKVRGAAQRRLPAALVPDQVFLGERPPLLPSGKTDRAAVRELVLRERGAKGSRREEPATVQDGVEPFITGLWRSCLDIDEFGPDESFFELGGHSLLAVEMVSAVGEHLGIEVSLGEFFEEPTVRTVVALATAALGEETAD